MISFFIRKVNISASLSQFNLIKHYLVIKDDNNYNGQTYANKKNKQKFIFGNGVN